MVHLESSVKLLGKQQKKTHHWLGRKKKSLRSRKSIIFVETLKTRFHKLNLGTEQSYECTQNRTPEENVPSYQMGTPNSKHRVKDESQGHAG